jgi:hypothetical protein
MLAQLEGLLGTEDLSEWEQKFVSNCLVQSDQGQHTPKLSGKQVEKIEQVWEKHFAG